MNNYHIYAEIGRGKGSVVYKGREKKTINYVAIKSVEKQYKNKVLNEVAVLYSLVHPHILRFLNWYETSKHIWLIVEYCTGGDLLAMIRLDQAMPEEACKKCASDILQGLQFVHSKGYIYGDLKPSNILVNEYGTLLLCDFGLAKKVMSEEEYNKALEAGEQGGKRGSPYYMSPELFYSDGIHSFASDLWAFGACLHELARGRPPFYSKDLEEVVTSILQDQPQRLPMVGDDTATEHDGPHRFSCELQDLLDRCLEKDPAQRITWDELRVHPWIQTLPVKLEVLQLPTQPAFDKIFRPTPPPQSQSQFHASPPNLRRSESLSKPVDVMRLSFQAKKNRAMEAEVSKAAGDPSNAVIETKPHQHQQQRQQQKQRHSLGAGSDEVEERLDGTLTLHSFDAELDFSAGGTTEVHVDEEDMPERVPTSSNTARENATHKERLLRQPTRPTQPSELDQMEQQLAQLHAAEEEEEEEDADGGDHDNYADGDDGGDVDDVYGGGDIDDSSVDPHSWHDHPPPRDAFRSVSHTRANTSRHHSSAATVDEDYSDAMDLNDAHGGGREQYHHRNDEDGEYEYEDDADLEAYPHQPYHSSSHSRNDSNLSIFALNRSDSHSMPPLSTPSSASSAAPASKSASTRKGSAGPGASRLPILATRNGSTSHTATPTTSTTRKANTATTTKHTTSSATTAATRKQTTSSSSTASSSSSSSRKAPSTPSTSALSRARPKSTERGPSSSPQAARSQKPGTSGAGGAKSSATRNAALAGEAWQETKR